MKIKKFDNRLEKIPKEIWALVNAIDELKGRWIGGAQLNPQVLGQLKRSVLITSAGASTRIEGARLSDEDVEKFMRGISIQRFSARDKQEVKGYYELLVNVFDAWKSIKFSESSIKHLHKELLKYVEKDARHRGDYKKGENKVVATNEKGEEVGVIVDTVSAYLTPKAMQELIEWTIQALYEKKYHPLLVISAFLVEFLAIHPFQDGNGRLSRILTNLLLLKAGYVYVPYSSHEKLIEDSKTEYYISLRKSQKTFATKKENIILWLEFFLRVCLAQAQTAIELISHENVERLFSPKQRVVWQYIEKANGEVTPGDIARMTKVSRPTVNQVLEKLLKLKKIERIGLGRATRYRKLD